MEEIKEDSQRGNEEDIESDTENEVKNNNNNNPNKMNINNQIINNEDATPNNNNNFNNENNNKNKNNKNNLVDDLDATESEGTMPIANEGLHDDNFEIEINLENEFKEIMDTNPKEDIDTYIDKIKNRFNKVKMSKMNSKIKKSVNENSDNTIDDTNKNPSIHPPNNIFFESFRKFNNFSNQ